MFVGQTHIFIYQMYNWSKFTKIRLGEGKNATECDVSVFGQRSTMQRSNGSKRDDLQEKFIVLNVCVRQPTVTRFKRYGQSNIHQVYFMLRK